MLSGGISNMAVNDVVQAISGANTTLNFQPAATVEVVILSVNSIAAQPPRLTDGANSTNHGISDNHYNMKFFVTNSFYLQIDNIGGTGRTGYCGIVTQ
jgi:hypothetical protein|tara:strand:- start:206 stop:499 length:294 start_codon:yes stop_codon:yes gene_type:complete